MSTLGDKWRDNVADQHCGCPECHTIMKCAKEHDTWLAERCRLIEGLTSVISYNSVVAVSRDAVLRILREETS